MPSALDNRPLAFDEFWQRVPRALLVSATPGDVENEWCADRMVDMVVRPSGVVDPPVKIFPRANQLPQLAAAVRERAQRGEATLVCALTKADCEDLAGYLNEIGGCRADWLHSELTAPQRAEKLQRLQGGEIDVLVGAQLLREGLDVPQVSLVAVLDAGVPGFMRSARSLMQMHGRAARNARGECHLFADGPPYTDAMNAAIDEINRRREKQRDFNTRNGITPTNADRGVVVVVAVAVPGDGGGDRGGTRRHRGNVHRAREHPGGGRDAVRAGRRRRGVRPERGGGGSGAQGVAVET